MNNHDSLKNNKQKFRYKKMTFLQKFVSAICVNAFVATSLFFFSPMEVYLGNIIEFAFPFNNLWWILLSFSAVVALAVSLLEQLLPDRAFVPVNALIFSIGLCFYLQAMFMNGKMGTLTGDEAGYSNGTIIVNIIMWLLIIAVVMVASYLLTKNKKRKLSLSIVKYVALALICMQTVAFFSVYSSIDSENFVKNDYLTNEGEFMLSDKNNVIVFIIDTCDGAYVQNTLAQYPDLMDNLKGFTYFTNATSTHSRTYPSVPFLLTGNMCYFNMPYRDYVNTAYKNSSFIPDMYDNDCDVRLFTENQYIGDSVKPKVKNHMGIKQSSLSIISVPDVIGQMAKISMYRDAPYVIKDNYKYKSNEVNKLVSKAKNKYASEDDAGFYNDLLNKKIYVDSNTDSAFRFYHFWGAHPGCSIDENAQPSAQSTTEKAIKGDIHIIEEYIKQMQELGIYKDSTIIITADHGNSGGNGTDKLEIFASACPILIVKPAGADVDEDCTISTAPVCHEDLFPTINKALGIDSEMTNGKKTIFEYKEDEVRDRLYYYTSLYTDDDGEVALREYKVKGDARDLNNWKLTGKNWDVDYSERAVSKKRLKDVEPDAKIQNYDYK